MSAPGTKRAGPQRSCRDRRRERDQPCRLLNRRTDQLSFDAMPEAGETVVMKFGGTSVADAERVKVAALRIVQRKEEGNRVVAVLSARGKTTDQLVAMAYEVSERPHAREMDMLLLHRRADLVRARRHGDQRPRSPGDLAHRLPGRDRHEHLAPRPRSSRSAPTASRQGLDEGKIVLVAGFQGSRRRRHHAGPGRLRHHGRGPGGGAGRGRVRDLHRRRGRVQRRPADRP